MAQKEKKIVCSSCGFANTPPLASNRCVSCGVKLEDEGRRSGRHDDLERRFQQEGFSLKWFAISLVIMLVMTAALVAGLPVIVPPLDFEGSAVLAGGNAEIQSLMLALFAEAQAQGRLRSSDLSLAVIVSRAFVYGLARMHADGHFPSWNVAAGETEAVMARALRVFVDLLARDTAAAKPRRPACRTGRRT